MTECASRRTPGRNFESHIGARKFNSEANAGPQSTDEETCSRASTFDQPRGIERHLKHERMATGALDCFADQFLRSL
jgi:hypothetical protein